MKRWWRCSNDFIVSFKLVMHIRYASDNDLEYLIEHDLHVTVWVITLKIKSKEIYIIEWSERIWFLRWNLFRDNTPFVNTITIHDSYQRLWYWRKILSQFESDMKLKWYENIMTSSLSNEKWQFFRRSCWYKDIW